MMFYYNTCNIKRMKAKKNELPIEKTSITSMDKVIQDALWPFEMVIVRRRHNVHLMVQIEGNIQMVTDWELYKLIIFNLIQNSVKYNK